MDSLLDLPGKLASALIALALILMAFQGPPSGGSPKLAKNQPRFPYFLAAMAQKERGHPLLRKAAARYIRLSSGEDIDPR